MEGLKYQEIHAIIKEKGYTGTQNAIRDIISKKRRIHQERFTFSGILNIVNEFKTILQSKRPETLWPWMEKAASLDITELNSFVEGLKLDLDAVMNTISYSYNISLSENVNKIQVIKNALRIAAVSSLCLKARA